MKNKEETTKVEQKQRTLKDLSELELKALAFDANMKITQLQNEYQLVVNELIERQKK